MSKRHKFFGGISFLLVFPGIYFAYLVVRTWFLFWFPEKWVIDVFVLSLPVLLFLVVFSLNYFKRFSKSRFSVPLISAVCIALQAFLHFRLFGILNA